MSTLVANVVESHTGQPVQFPHGIWVEGAAGLPANRNRIINGDMRIDQRNAGAVVNPADNAYTLDRWCQRVAGTGVYTVRRSTTVPAGQGFVNSIQATVTTASTSIAAGDIYTFHHKIEGGNTSDLMWGTANAKQVTLSFWVRSSQPGTYSVAFLNADANRGYAATYTINAADTWEYKTITIAGDTTGTWNTNNLGSIIVSFCLACGTDKTEQAGSWSANNVQGADGTFNWMANSGATFYMTGVQFEVGHVATSFDFRSIGTELALCQRYLPALNHAANNDLIGIGYSYSTTAALIAINHAVSARVPPTGLTVVNPASINVANGNGGQTAISSAGFIYGGINQSMIQLNTTGLTAGQGCYAKSTNTYQILFTGCEL